MAQEDQTQRCSNSNTSSGGGIGNDIGRSSKKRRPKKVPQRGLGVAQLEKIRIEEQQKKDAATILPSQSSVVLSPTTRHKSSYLSLPIPSFHPSKQSCSSSASSIPFLADLSPPNSIFKTPLSVQNIDIASTGTTVPLTCSGSPGWYPGVAVLPGNESVNNVHKFWSSCDYNVEEECSVLDPGLALRTNLSLAYESEPIWPLPSLKQRAQPFQQPSSSMVNLSPRTSTSVLNFQMEPPSNQSYHGNCTPSLPEDEKVVRLKRSYPFSLDNAPGPPIHMTKYHPIAHSINGQVEEASSRNGSAFNFKPGTLNFREGPSCSTSNSEPKSKKSIEQNGVFDGDFLTLAPPTTTSMCSSSKLRHPPSNLIYYNCELPDLESLASHASFGDSIIRQGAIGLNQYYRPYYSFFPPAMVQIDRATTITMANCNGGEVGGHVDLNLKL